VQQIGEEAAMRQKHPRAADEQRALYQRLDSWLASRGVTSAGDTNTGKSIDRPSKRISPEAQCISRELASKAMASVSPTLREAFVLYVVEGWTQKELSVRKGIALQTVKTRIFRARRKMKEHLSVDLDCAAGVK